MIKGKVVEIINNRTVAINVGSNKNVKSGMIFQIMVDSGKEIHDPDTNQLLGTMKLPNVKVTHVDEKFSLAETYEYETVNIGGINTFSNLSTLFSPPKYVKRYKIFEIDEEQKTSISKEKSTVKVGDIVEEVNAEVEIITS